MHAAPRNFVEGVLATAETRGPLAVLEVGSYDVNGSIRSAIRRSPIGLHLRDYIGADLTPGPGVDVVASGADLHYDDGHFDLVLSLECFEHNPYWRETMANMERMLKPGGWCIVTCASLGRPEHGTTRSEALSSPGTQAAGWDYYHNIGLREFRSALPLDRWFDFSVLGYGAAWNDLYFAGRKYGAASALTVQPGFEEAWRRACSNTEAAQLKRRLTHVLERAMGGRAFQDFYVNVWRSLKPR